MLTCSNILAQQREDKKFVLGLLKYSTVWLSTIQLQHKRLDLLSIPSVVDSGITMPAGYLWFCSYDSALTGN